MNLAEYDGGAACGACVELSQGGRNVTITVADSCNPAINNTGTCTNGHIDLSRTAFQQLTGQNTGDINGVQWRMVPCDGVSNVNEVPSRFSRHARCLDSFCLWPESRFGISTSAVHETAVYRDSALRIHAPVLAELN